MRAISTTFALLLSGPVSAAEPLELVLHEPSGRPAPSEACDVPLCQTLVSLLDGATTSIDFAFYGLRGQPEIARALFDAQARGVAVRGYIDRTLDGKNYYADSDAVAAKLGTVRDDLAVDQRTAEKRAAQRDWPSRCWLPRPEGHEGPLQCAGYGIGPDGDGDGLADTCVLGAFASTDDLTFEGDIMHHKFAVVDGAHVWMGSTNASDSGTGGYNANLVAVVHDPVVAGWYSTEFAMLWEGSGHHEKRSQGQMVRELAPGVVVEGLFSPQDQPITNAVRPLLQAATKRIDVAIFFLTHKGIAADLIAAHRRGVQVRVVMDATAAKNEYAKHEMLRAAGIPVKIEAWGGKMHMKAAAIDGEHVVAGSMNWTSAGEGGNDENTLIVHSAAHAAQFHAFYDAMWAKVPDTWLTGRPDPESLQSGSACTDGSDNDFDHLRDADDPGCGPTPPPLPPIPPVWTVPRGPHPQLVKGNVSPKGYRSYYIPSHGGYDDVTIEPERGEGWYCSEDEAREAGFRRAR